MELKKDQPPYLYSVTAHLLLAQIKQAPLIADVHLRKRKTFAFISPLLVLFWCNVFHCLLLSISSCIGHSFLTKSFAKKKSRKSKVGTKRGCQGAVGQRGCSHLWSWDLSRYLSSVCCVWDIWCVYFPHVHGGCQWGASTPGAGGAWQQDLDGGGTYGDDASCGDLVPQEHQE